MLRYHRKENMLNIIFLPRPLFLLVPKMFTCEKQRKIAR